MSDQLRWSAPIDVSDHAVDRACERLRWMGSGDEIADRIRGEIRSAILADRVTTTRPNWTRAELDGRRNEEATESGALFVWDEDVSRCWVVYRRQGVIRVASVFEEYVNVRDRAERSQRLRRGLGYQ